MKTEGRRQSENVEDRRGQRMGGRLPGGRIGAGGGLGLIVIVVLALVFGVDPTQLLSSMEGGGTAVETPAGPYQETAEEAKRSDFIKVILADTEDVWNAIFTASGQSYREPTLVLYRDATQSSCGVGQSAMGPFYCPVDQKVYLDLSFYDNMAGKLGAQGDFAFAYVVAHEVGHHVQTLLGTSAKVQNARKGVSEAEGNELSVRQELQADCYAGVWAYHTEKQKQVLESGDIQEAMNAAAAVGDDRLQQRGQGYVVPESFTHGTSAQRAKWFDRGLKSGDPNQCDTFGAADL